MYVLIELVRSLGNVDCILQHETFVLFGTLIRQCDVRFPNLNLKLIKFHVSLYTKLEEFSKIQGGYLKEQKNGLPNMEGWYFHFYKDSRYSRVNGRKGLNAKQTQALKENIFYKN